MLECKGIALIVFHKTGTKSLRSSAADLPVPPARLILTQRMWRLTCIVHLCYYLTMRTKNKPDGQTAPSFIETARRAQIIEKAIETITDLGYAQASLAQIAHKAGISKGVITYYFTNKEELIRQVAIEILSTAAKSVTPQIVAQPTAKLRLQAYIRSAVEYIGSHHTQMVALIEILNQYRGVSGKPIFDQDLQETILADLEVMLRQGQAEGDFRSFDLRVMAVTIRRAIDAVPYQYAANPNLDVSAYARELSKLFDRATCPE